MSDDPPSPLPTVPLKFQGCHLIPLSYLCLVFLPSSLALSVFPISVLFFCLVLLLFPSSYLCLVFLPSSLALSVLSFFCKGSILPTFFAKKLIFR